MSVDVNSSTINYNNLYSEPNANSTLNNNLYNYSSATNQSSVNSSPAAVYSSSQSYSFGTYNSQGSTVPPSPAYANTSSVSNVSITPLTSYVSTSNAGTIPPTPSVSIPDVSITPSTPSGGTSNVSTIPPTPSGSTSGSSVVPPTSSGSTPVISTIPPTPSVDTSGSGYVPPYSNGGTSTTGTTNSSDDSTDYIDVDDLEHIDDEISSFSTGSDDKYQYLTEEEKTNYGNMLIKLKYDVQSINSFSTPYVVENSFLSAIKKFQKDHQSLYNLAVTGKPNAKTLNAIQSEAGDCVAAKQLNDFGFYFGSTRTERESNLAELNRVLKKYNINTPIRIAFFLGEVAHESSFGSRTLEKFNGSSPETYFNKKYSNDSDLGNKGSNDGELFRGSGYLHVTGRYNYQQFANYIKNQSIMKDGYRLIGGEYNKPVSQIKSQDVGVIDLGKYAWESAGWFWEYGNPSGKDLNNLADIKDYSGVLDGVNKKDRATLGIRNEYINKMYKILTGKALGLPQ